MPGRGATVAILPGNPGSARFYLPFMQSLHALLREEVSVIAASFPGHETSPSGRYLSLSETIDVVREELAAVNPSLVIGHSIGAYMAMQAAPERPQVALFPFVQFDEAAWRQRALRRLARRPATMWAILRALPPGVRRVLESWFASGVRLLEERPVMASFTLARHEFADLAAPFAPPCQPMVISAARDVWFPQKHRGVFTDVTVMHGVQHCFCINREQSHRVADAIAVRWGGRLCASSL